MPIAEPFDTDAQAIDIDRYADAYVSRSRRHRHRRSLPPPGPDTLVDADAAGHISSLYCCPSPARRAICRRSCFQGVGHASAPDGLPCALSWAAHAGIPRSSDIFDQPDQSWMAGTSRSMPCSTLSGESSNGEEARSDIATQQAARLVEASDMSMACDDLA